MHERERERARWFSVWKNTTGRFESRGLQLRSRRSQKPAAPHRQVARLPVDFDAQVGGEVVFLRAAGLRQAEPQLDLDGEVALLRRPSEHREQHRNTSAPSPGRKRKKPRKSLRRRLSHMELLICWTCCGVNAKAKHVSWKRWLLSAAAETHGEYKHCHQ